MRIKNILFALLLSVVSSPLVMAGEYEDALAAHGREDYKTALQLFKNAAQQGYAPAQYSLGVMYDQGQGVPQDYAEAVKWYRLAAQQGYVDAQGNLGAMYFNGKGVPKDRVKAHLWFNISATSGDTDAIERRNKAENLMTPEQIAEAQKMAKDCVSNKLKGCN